MESGGTLHTLGAHVEQAVAFLRQQRAPSSDVVIILGSGLGGIAQHVHPRLMIPYHEIPHFPPATADGHYGQLLFGDWAGCSVAVLLGRAHLYEGYTPQQLTIPVRVLHTLGSRYLVVTNAAGGLHPFFQPGDLMLIRDHISLQWLNGLCASDQQCVRAPAYRPIYDEGGCRAAVWAAREARVRLVEGVYVGVVGPNYETRAEYRMLRQIGGDAVGMSTLCETLAAAELNMRTLAISVIANVARPDAPEKLSHGDVLRAVEEAQANLTRLLHLVLSQSAWINRPDGPTGKI